MSFLGKIISLGKPPQTSASSEQYILIEDRKAAGVSGGTFTTEAWRQRDLNTIVQDDTGEALVSANTVYLPAGKYRILASAPAVAADAHQCRLVDNETGHALLTGTSEVPGASTVSTRSFIAGQFTLSGTGQIIIEHRSSRTVNANGFGYPSQFEGPEIYTRMELFYTPL